MDESEVSAYLVVHTCTVPNVLQQQAEQRLCKIGEKRRESSIHEWSKIWISVYCTRVA